MQLPFGPVVVVPADVPALVHELIVIFIPLAVGPDCWPYAQNALLHIPIVDCYGSFLLLSVRAPLSERSVYLVEPRVPSTYSYLGPLASSYPA